MPTINKTLTRGQIDREKYKILCGFLRGYSVSANAEYLKPGQAEALGELAGEGICFLDKPRAAVNKSGVARGKSVEVDPGDALGRYRMVSGQHSAALQMTEQMDGIASKGHK